MRNPRRVSCFHFSGILIAWEGEKIKYEAGFFSKSVKSLYWFEWNSIRKWLMLLETSTSYFLLCMHSTELAFCSWVFFFDFRNKLYHCKIFNTQWRKLTFLYLFTMKKIFIPITLLIINDCNSMWFECHWIELLLRHGRPRINYCASLYCLLSIIWAALRSNKTCFFFLRCSWLS